jgi:hypothetical protein
MDAAARVVKGMAMTEEEWLACADPAPMLEFLRGRATDRRLRLFAVTCCRRVASLLPDDATRSSVEVCERFADGLASAAELHQARQVAVAAFDAFQDTDEFGNVTGAESASAVVAGACWPPEVEGRYEGLDSVIDNAVGLGKVYTGWRNGGQIETRRQCRSIRDIFGNPFRPSPPLPPAVLAWNDSTVTRMAQGIYEDRAFDRLPILADALLDAGCEDEELIRHCRSEGPHVRGCWAVDAILGKE